MPRTRAQTIKSRTENLLKVRKFIGEEARRFGFSDEETSKIVLAVDEACTNIIRHAYQNDPQKEIRVSVQTKDAVFQVRIEDRGRSFDPMAIKPPNLKEQIGRSRRGGLGMYLMRTLMDEVEYDFRPSKKNVVRLTKYLPQNR